MIEFEVGGNKYQARNMLPFDQLIVAKRLMPVLKNVITPELIAAALAPGGDKASALSTVNVGKILPTLADAFYSLADDDMKTILDKTLGVVSRRGQGGAYSSLLSPSGAGIPFDDVKLPQMLEIAWKVIEGQVGDFFSTAP